MRLKKNITIFPRLVETRTQSIAFSVRARDTHLLTIVNIKTIQREHFDIYVNLAEVGYQQLLSISAPLIMPMVLSRALIDIIII